MHTVQLTVQTGPPALPTFSNPLQTLPSLLKEESTFAVSVAPLPTIWLDLIDGEHHRVPCWSRWLFLGSFFVVVCFLFHLFVSINCSKLMASFSCFYTVLLGLQLNGSLLVFILLWQLLFCFFISSSARVSLRAPAWAFVPDLYPLCGRCDVSWSFRCNGHSTNWLPDSYLLVLIYFQISMPTLQTAGCTAAHPASPLTCSKPFSTLYFAPPFGFSWKTLCTAKGKDLGVTPLD